MCEIASCRPAEVAAGIRLALRRLRRPDGAVAGAVAFWAFQIAVLWAAFEAFGDAPAVGVLIVGFFVGMLGNLLPFPGGIGGVDGGMIGAFVLFGLPENTVFPAILIYRLVAFWMPIPFGVVAFFQLRTRVQHWEADGLPIDRRPRAKAELEPAAD